MAIRSSVVVGMAFPVLYSHLSLFIKSILKKALTKDSGRLLAVCDLNERIFKYFIDDLIRLSQIKQELLIPFLVFNH